VSDAAPPTTLGETVLGPHLGAAAIALGDEAEAIDRMDEHVELGDGRLVAAGTEEYVYRFRAAAVPRADPDTPVTLRTGDREPVSASVVSADEFDLLVATGRDLGARVARTRAQSRLSFIPLAMRGRLVASLEEAAARDVAIPLALCGLVPIAAPALDGAPPLPSLRLTPNRAQRTVLERVRGSRLHLVWGPPGTGKTTTLGQVVRMLTDAGERVLILAHANVAVDAATLRAADLLAGTGLVEEGAVVRLGTPRLPEVRARAEITPEGILGRRDPALMEALAHARRERDRAVRAVERAAPYDPFAVDRLAAVRREVRSVERRVRDAEGGLIAEARVVAATLSRLVLSRALWEWRPETVVLDEAAAVGVAPALVAALAARHRLVLFGDFRQLPPIVAADSEIAHRWLGRSAFASTGAEEAVDQGREHPGMTLLDTQYRMAREIGEPVSRLAYGGRIATVDMTAVRRIAGRPPFPGERIVLEDTDAVGARAAVDTVVAPGSRFNPISALLAVDRAAAAAEAGSSVAVITPYRSQARLLWSLLRDRDLGERVNAATVHRFQGSESDVVVIDLVDAAPLDRPSRLTAAGDTALRLMNVALSRARGKVIVLLSQTFLEAHQPAASPVVRAWHLLGGAEATRPAVTASQEMPARGRAAALVALMYGSGTRDRI